MKSAVQRSAREVCKRMQCQQRRISHSRSYTSTFPLEPTSSSSFPVETGWEYLGDDNDNNDDGTFPSLLEGTLNRMFEFNRLGKEEEMCSWESVVRSSGASKEQLRCPICGQPKSMDELCPHCTTSFSKTAF